MCFYDSVTIFSNDARCSNYNLYVLNLNHPSCLWYSSVFRYTYIHLPHILIACTDNCKRSLLIVPFSNSTLSRSRISSFLIIIPYYNTFFSKIVFQLPAVGSDLSLSISIFLTHMLRLIECTLIHHCFGFFPCVPSPYYYLSLSYKIGYF